MTAAAPAPAPVPVPVPVPWSVPVPVSEPVRVPVPVPAPVVYVEDLLADLQLARAGLPGRDPVPAARRAREAAGELAEMGLTRFVAELLGETEPVPAPVAVLDLEADEDGRRASYGIWCAEARELTDEVWRWLIERRRAAAELPWWCGESALPLPHDSVRRLAEVTAPVRDLSELAAAWARPTGLRGSATAEYNWRWLLLGKGLLGPSDEAPGEASGEASDGVSGEALPPLPPLNELITLLVGAARRCGLLPLAHQVKVLRRPNTPSMVMPVRLPGVSLLSLPTAVTPVTVQYVQHELAHLAEHALRPADAPLVERWTFDPLRSEGWALLLEHLAGSTAFLARLGIDEETAAALARFYAEEERFSRGLMAADLALDADLAGCRTSAEALDAASAVAVGTGLRWAPELLLLRQTRVLHWRSYLAGYAWRDAVRAELDARFGDGDDNNCAEGDGNSCGEGDGNSCGEGDGWADREEAWALLRSALARTGAAGSAAGFLDALRVPEPTTPYAPDPTRRPDDDG
ncbi:hypothetical protein [Streptomyces sp. NBC_00878]|uniref:hypothetical protein n=1 Tax=Streptomyces sp. NBC_00878 TaxID=2975854 RepID=UPI002257633E|nr:hypothetical protein [Streptomyces sp. NBC_00878]MCX4907257.1 hypothetical protein [Streptomyces sp. NBC_00878]